MSDEDKMMMDKSIKWSEPSVINNNKIELPTKKEQANNIRNKENEFLDYLGISREDLSDDGADLQELKELGGFNDWSNNNNWDYLFNNSSFKSMTIKISLIVLNLFIYSYLLNSILKLWLNK